MKNSLSLSFKQRLAFKVFNRYRKLQHKVHDLSYLFWECTVRCNLNCLHCGSDCRADHTKQDMPAKDFLAVTKDISKHYNPNKVMIVFTGGEPLMRADLEETGLELYKQGYPWGMVTNGRLLTQERLQKLLNAGLRSATVSLDGTEEDHNWLRGKKDSFAYALNAVQILAKQPDIAFDVVTCINSRNINKLNDIKNLLIASGVKHWRLFHISPIGRASDESELSITPNQFKILIEFISECRQEKKIIASFGCEGYMGAYEGKVRTGYFFCRAGINIASVLNDGSISACPNNSKNVIQGNIYQDNFMDVWNNRFQIMRNREWNKQGKCATCKSYRNCQGNGLHLWDFENNDIMVCHLELLQQCNH